MKAKQETNACSGNYCCIEVPGRGIDPLSVPNVMPAGTACGGAETYPVTLASGNECMLATAYFPEQIYVAAFMPETAFKKGTLFPELHFPYCKGGVK